MTRNRNHFIRGQAVDTTSDSYWEDEQVVAFVRALKSSLKNPAASARMDELPIR